MDEYQTQCDPNNEFIDVLYLSVITAVISTDIAEMYFAYHLNLSAFQ